MLYLRQRRQRQEVAPVPRVKEHDMRKAVSIPRELAEAIADYRFDERISTESEAIRLLIVAGLQAKGRTVKPPERNGTKA